jgi:hypothetical protein
MSAMTKPQGVTAFRSECEETSGCSKAQSWKKRRKRRKKKLGISLPEETKKRLEGKKLPKLRTPKKTGKNKAL